jgi:nucleotide-binding universal stress UspA family protein
MPATLNTILAAYDGTRPAEQALRRAAEFAQSFDAKVVVVSVTTPAPVVPPAAFGLVPYYSYRSLELEELPQVNEAVWQQHREQVQALFAGAGVRVEFVGVVGVPDEEIVEVAEQQHADLIVVGTREPGFFERVLGGSVSQDVARRAHCDVLIVHPRADDAASTSPST